MSRPPYHSLQNRFRVFFVLLAVGALFMIFGSRPLIVRVFMHPPESEGSTLLLFVLKEMGGLVLMLGGILVLASRDPERNVAIIYAFVAGLCILVSHLYCLLRCWTSRESIRGTSSGAAHW